MQKLLFLSVLLFALPPSNKLKTLKGTWTYAGGKFNHKLSAAPKGYTQQRKYTDTAFTAYLIEPGQQPEKYEAGRYTLKGDTCLETQTYSMQASKLLGVTVHYGYALHHDTLVLKGTLPNGAVIEDYWKKVK